MINFKENKLKEEEEVNNSTSTLMISLAEEVAVASILETSNMVDNNKSKKKLAQNFSLEVMWSSSTFNQ